MAENTKRALFGLSGITGMLIATVLLLSILVVLTILAIKTEQAQSSNFYNPASIVGSLDNVKPHSTGNAKFSFPPVK